MHTSCRWLIALCALGLAPAAMAAPPAAGTTPYTLSQFQRDLVNVLALRSEAKPLLGAALLTRTLTDLPDIVSYHTLIGRAAAAPDAGAAVSWEQLTDCSHAAQDCPNPKALARLEAQAPDNAAVWLTLLGAAVHHDQHKTARAAFTKAAAASHYDAYAGTSVAALAMAAGTLPPPTSLYTHNVLANSAAGVRTVLVFGLGHFEPLRGLQAASERCTKGHDAKALRGQCLKLANLLVWGSSPRARAVGLHLQQTLATDPDERSTAAAEWTDLVWQVHRFGILSIEAAHDPALAKRLMDLARTGGTRMSLILAALRGSGIPTHAPAGWKPNQSKAKPTSDASAPAPASSIP